ncbi:MAG: Uma2 family endonuclease [Isosphaeraceae bacterium]
MSTVTTKREAGAVDERPGESRFLVPDAPWRVYETMADSLPESTPVRLAYDGRDLEIMTKGPDHEDFRILLGHIVVEVARVLRLRCKGLGETTWKRPEINRGIEADQCFYFNKAKLEVAARQRGSNDVTGFPNPDLAIEVDLSPSRIDRPGIYAAMRVPEIWRFNGKVLRIERLRSAGRYVKVQKSVFLRIRAEDVTRWLVDEDSTDEIAWLERLSAWLRNEWKR